MNIASGLVKFVAVRSLIDPYFWRHLLAHLPNTRPLGFHFHGELATRFSLYIYLFISQVFILKLTGLDKHDKYLSNNFTLFYTFLFRMF
jgi:hypothetical protein